MYHVILWDIDKKIYKNGWELLFNQDNSKDYCLIWKSKFKVKGVILIKRTSRDCIRIMAQDCQRIITTYTSARTAHQAAVKINKIIKEIEKMKGMAIYLGYRETKTKKRVDEETGDVIPAMNAKSHTFFQNEWEGAELKEQGLFFNEFVKEDEEQPNYKVGELYEIQITDITSRRCKGVR